MLRTEGLLLYNSYILKDYCYTKYTLMLCTVGLLLYWVHINVIYTVGLLFYSKQINVVYCRITVVLSKN